MNLNINLNYCRELLLLIIASNRQQRLTKLYLKQMKTKKLSITISSILSQCILQNRNSSLQASSRKIETLQDNINNMHRHNHYSKQLCYDLIDQPQYKIEQKLNYKQNRIIKDISILIHFKLTQKVSSNVTFIQSWVVSTQRTERPLKITRLDFNQQIIYLIQEMLRALKCQFLSDFLNMKQQFRTKYILDYEIQINPSKRSMRKLSCLSYEHMWKKTSFIDNHNILAVKCYHGTHRKIKSVISQNRVESRYRTKKPKMKHGSEDTKPSNSGEYEICSSFQEKRCHKKRKTSLIQFYDQDLNITVLSNDSDSFRRSFGGIQGRMQEIHLNQSLLDQKSQKAQESDDQFQLLIQESMHEQLQTGTLQYINSLRIKEIQREFQFILNGLDKELEGFFN